MAPRGAGMSGAICSACRITRPTDALLCVTDRATGRRRYVCRPTVRVKEWGEPCFARNVRSASLDAICLALDAPKQERQEPKAGRRGAFDASGYSPTMLGEAMTA